MADIQETPRGDFAVTGEVSPVRAETVTVPRAVMLDWVESWTERKIELYLRGGE